MLFRSQVTDYRSGKTFEERKTQVFPRSDFVMFDVIEERYEVDTPVDADTLTVQDSGVGELPV